MSADGDRYVGTWLMGNVIELVQVDNPVDLPFRNKRIFELKYREGQRLGAVRLMEMRFLDGQKELLTGYWFQDRDLVFLSTADGNSTTVIQHVEGAGLKSLFVTGDPLVGTWDGVDVPPSTAP